MRGEREAGGERQRPFKIVSRLYLFMKVLVKRSGKTSLLFAGHTLRIQRESEAANRLSFCPSKCPSSSPTHLMLLRRKWPKRETDDMY